MRPTWRNASCPRAVSHLPPRTRTRTRNRCGRFRRPRRGTRQSANRIRRSAWGGCSTPASIQENFTAGFSGVPPADWASIKAPRLGIFAQFTIKARQPWYWYLSAAQKTQFNKAWRPIVAWHRRTIRKFARRNSANTVRLPGAPHYAYIQNEAEVVRSMREFLGIPL